MTVLTPDSILDAIKPHVPFDGWSDTSFKEACADLGITAHEGRQIVPRGAVGLAALFHKKGDAQMRHALRDADTSGMRYSEKVAHAIWLRLDVVEDKELVRRGTALFSLPHLAPEGTALVWGTADAIWTALGDTSDDGNWYSKRATLSAVFGSVVVFWLGDMSDGQIDTCGFIDRRINDVMEFEKFKARANANPLLRPVTRPLGYLMSSLKAPRRTETNDTPGVWSPSK